VNNNLPIVSLERLTCTDMLVLKLSVTLFLTAWHVICLIYCTVGVLLIGTFVFEYPTAKLANERRFV